MRSQNKYEFQSEAEATEFAAKVRFNKCPSEDLYVHGPVYMDEDKAFKNMAFVNPGRKYWLVTVESYK